MEDLTGYLKAICISEKRGTAKHPVDKAVLKEGYGIEGDAHAGDWHRQVSLLSSSKVDDFNKMGACVSDGDFGENILVEEIDCAKLPIGSLLKFGEDDKGAVIKITQRGKQCHTHCAIREKTGDCIMPREGVFAEVIRGGIIKQGDKIRVTFPDINRPFTAAAVVLSRPTATVP